MIRKLKLAAASLLLVASLAAGLSAPALADGATTFTNDACQGISQLGGGDSCAPGSSSSGVTNIVKIIITILSYVVGVVAVIMIIIAGLSYVTSGGDSNKVSSAKSTLLYALIGLVVAVLAQFIVHFAFGQATSGSCKSNGTIAANDSACK